jgi:uncharacterized protein (TIGR02118 family)
MYKLMILFKKPKNEEEFERFYYEEFMPIAVDVNGLERIELTNIQLPLGIVRDTPSPFELQVEFYFQTRQSFEFFMGESELGQEFQEKLSQYSEPIYTFAYGLTEVISKSEIIARYNENMIRSSSQ